ncbi:hypothetical protein EsDP_00003462 [Epichloe bromicola]|uniref:Uncharacterized protein n=1 Tax=Epichloe bromicola TaxID=79588 RepID=A0ABQ0CNV5_9HYPO
MDPDADTDAAAAIAQAMGFSSFGAQDHHPQKRRKYGPAESITSASATGSNSTPLGAPSPKPKPATDSDSDPDGIDPDRDEADAPRETTPSQEPREPPLASMPAHPPAGRGGFVGGASSGSHATRGRRVGVGVGVERRHNEPWYTGYYDCTSNENPWERLEKSMGLRTRGGTWVPRSSWTPATT